MLTCNGNSSYYYSRSGHRMVGGNGTTVSGATEMFGDAAAGGLRANRSGAAALRSQGGSQLHYSSVSNLATSGVGRGGGGAGGGLLTTAPLSTRRESDFLSPSHALIGYESRVGVIAGKGPQKNGTFMKTSLSIGSKLATATRSSLKSDNFEGEDGDLEMKEKLKREKNERYKEFLCHAGFFCTNFVYF